MKNIKEFDSFKEFKDYANASIIRKIGEGSEGDVYASAGGKIIKVISSDFRDRQYEDYKDDIIMADDLQLASFIFPEELYLLHGRIIGYKEERFEDNIFGDNIVASKVDLKKLIEARKRFIEDAKVMTDMKYRLFELPRNVLFNNKDLVAIDTLDYSKERRITLEENIALLDYALLLELSSKYTDIDCNKPFDEEIQKVYKKS